MKYTKKPKYKLDKRKIVVKKDEDLTAEELYEERLREKSRRRKR